MNDWTPPWWDLLTILRLAGMVVFVVGWFVAGLTLAPWLFKKFDDATKGYVDWMVHTFDRMFMTVSRRACTLSIVASITVFATFGYWLTSALPWDPPGYHIIRLIIIGLLVLGPFGLPFGFKLPRFIVNQMWNRRLLKFEDQMLDALSFMSNGLRSGLSLVQCMEMVVEEISDPISQEYGLVLNEQRVGVAFEDALLNLERRIDSEDLQIMVTSINILRQSGGNLSETFETISYTIRERKKVQGKIRALTAQGIAQSVVITCLPFVLAAVLWTFDHQLIQRLWSTWIGWVLITIMLTLQTVGALIMKRIVTIRV